MTKYDFRTFPEPICPDGYTWPQLEEILDPTTFAELSHWMRGQTTMICEGRRYNHKLRQYETDECADNPHGGVVYMFDVHRFLGFLGPHQRGIWD